MKKRLALLLGFLLFGLAFMRTGFDVSGKTIEEIQKEIEQYEQEVQKLTAQSKTLANQIAQFDAQIRLTTLKIEQTEEKINLLGGRIDQLETSLDSLTTAFTSRAIETYKMNRFGDPVYFLVAADNLGDVVSRYHYLQRIQKADHDLLERLQKAQTIYVGEKEDQEVLQEELETQSARLAVQKQEKANLLAVTRNDERRFQQLLDSARAELAVVLGQGKETFLRDVGEGDTIGRVIPSASGCSSGQHLHFEVHQSGSIKNPNEFLRPISFSYDYSPDQYSYYGTISPSGSWSWPMNEPIQINQAYGTHGFAQSFYPGGIHHGYDMDSGSSTTVKAVKPGKLYAGSYQCGGRYPGALLYAKVDHGNGITTWYLHMTPQ